MTEIDRLGSQAIKRDVKLLKSFIAISIVIILFASIFLLRPAPSSVTSPVPAGINYTAHGVINIVGNSGFTAANGVTGGNGTPSDPYIISGWDINPNTGSSAGIRITGTSAHFVIRDCYVHGGVIMFGAIYIMNSAHGAIENCTLYNNLYQIGLYASNNMTVLNNTLEKSDVDALGLYSVGITSSNDNLIKGNRIANSSWWGINIESGSRNVVWRNILIHNNGAGLVPNPAHIQANDAGTNNRWNAIGSPNGYGNYWSDFLSPDADGDGLVDLPYNLSGAAGAKDNFPIASLGTGIPEFSECIIPIAGLIMVALIFSTARNKVLKEIQN